MWIALLLCVAAIGTSAVGLLAFMIWLDTLRMDREELEE
jgi:hypothetical protein